MKRFAAPKRVTVITLILLIAAGWRQGSPGEQITVSAASFCSAPFARYLPVLADFDGDQRLDQAEPHLSGGHQCIRVRFANSCERHLAIAGSAGGTLFARDVDRDDLPDLVWVSNSEREQVVVWLSNGSGEFSCAEHVDSQAIRAEVLGWRAKSGVNSKTQDDTQLYLAPENSPDCDFNSSSVTDTQQGLVIESCGNCQCTAGPYLSHLRERGPPQTLPLI